MSKESNLQRFLKSIKPEKLIVILGLIFLGLKLLYYPDPYLDLRHFNPAWAPDGSQIVFVSNRDGNRDENTGIYTIDADGSNLTRLTPDPYKLFYVYRDDESPAWSPDGKYIAFASAKGKRNFTTDFFITAFIDPFRTYLARAFEIYKMEVDGSNMLLISGDINNCNSPTWSPDGEKIAFVCFPQHWPAIYVANTDGTNIVRLSENGFECYSPSWSPDGKEIMFFCDQDIEGVPSIINVTDADGSNIRELAQLPNVGSVIWSPNGKSILVTELDASLKRDIIKMSVMNEDGTHLNQLSSEFIIAASWSPDSSQITYASVNTINVINADGTNAHAIFRMEDKNYFTYLGSPVWSPDGSHIVFDMWLLSKGIPDAKDTTGTQIYMMNADGSNLIQLMGK